MTREHEIKGLPGWSALFGLIAVIGAAIWLLDQGISPADGRIIALAVALTIVAGGCFAGLTVVNPNEAKVVTLFGVYKGTIKHPGFWWVNPLSTRRKVSLRVRNFESGKLKV